VADNVAVVSLSEERKRENDAGGAANRFDLANRAAEAEYRGLVERRRS
jgi:hypothetical protein